MGNFNEITELIEKYGAALQLDRHRSGQITVY
jgi:hypothetical protein